MTVILQNLPVFTDPTHLLWALPPNDPAPGGPRRGMVLCHGGFDVLHVGHVRHLRAAQQLGDYLLVSVTRDEWFRKGAGRPLFPQEVRAEVLASLSYVGAVLINPLGPTAAELIRFLKPEIYCKGVEYKTKPTPMLMEERKALESYGGRLEYVGEEMAHSTDIAVGLGLIGVRGR